MILKNNSKEVKTLLKYFETLNIENKLKIFIIVLESDMIKLKIEKYKLIEILKRILCIFDKNYNKNIIISLEYNMDVFVLAKVMEMNSKEMDNMVFEMFYIIYSYLFL